MALENKDIVTLGIAAYGAVLSSIVYLQSRIRDRRQLAVCVSPTFLAYPNGELSTQMASLDVINRGQRPTVVGAPRLRMPNKKYLTFIGADGFRDFPKRLQDGESGSVRITYYEIARALQRAGYSGKIKLRPTCSDSTGKEHRGKRWKFDADGEWKP